MRNNLLEERLILNIFVRLVRRSFKFVSRPPRQRSRVAKEEEVAIRRPIDIGSIYLSKHLEFGRNTRRRLNENARSRSDRCWSLEIVRMQMNLCQTRSLSPRRYRNSDVIVAPFSVSLCFLGANTQALIDSLVIGQLTGRTAPQIYRNLRWLFPNVARRADSTHFGFCSMAFRFRAKSAMWRNPELCKLHSSLRGSWDLRQNAAKIGQHWTNRS